MTSFAQQKIFNIVDNQQNIVENCTSTVGCLFAAGLARPVATAWFVTNFLMMTSSNGYIFRVTGHLCGEFTGPRWIPHTKASDAELWRSL